MRLRPEHIVMKSPSYPRVRHGLAAGLAAVLVALATAAPVAVPALPDDPACTDGDRRFMTRAYELAASAAAKGNSTYGAWLVKDGRILMEGLAVHAAHLTAATVR